MSETRECRVGAYRRVAEGGKRMRGSVAEGGRHMRASTNPHSLKCQLRLVTSLLAVQLRERTLL